MHKAIITFTFLIGSFLLFGLQASADILFDAKIKTSADDSWQECSVSHDDIQLYFTDKRNQELITPIPIAEVMGTSAGDRGFRINIVYYQQNNGSLSTKNVLLSFSSLYEKNTAIFELMQAVYPKQTFTPPMAAISNKKVIPIVNNKSGLAISTWQSYSSQLFIPIPVKHTPCHFMKGETELIAHIHRQVEANPTLNLSDYTLLIFGDDPNATIQTLAQSTLAGKTMESRSACHVISIGENTDTTHQFDEAKEAFYALMQYFK